MLKNFSHMRNVHSSLMGRDTYTGFYCNWIFVLFSLTGASLIVLSSATIYIGMFLYIDGLVRDLKMRLLAVADDFSIGSLNLERNWLIYVHEIKFHIQVFRFFS